MWNKSKFREITYYDFEVDDFGIEICVSSKCEIYLYIKEDFNTYILLGEREASSEGEMKRYAIQLAKNFFDRFLGLLELEQDKEYMERSLVCREK